MTLLIIGIVVMIGIHLVPAFPDVRERLIGQLGQNGYRLLFSVVSTLGLVLLIYGFAKAPVIQIWSPPYWTRYVAMVLMVPVFILLIAAYLPGECQGQAPVPRRHQDLGACPSHRQWRSRLHHPVRLVSRLRGVRSHRAQAASGDGIGDSC